MTVTEGAKLAHPSQEKLNTLTRLLEDTQQRAAAVRNQAMEIHSVLVGDPSGCLTKDQETPSRPAIQDVIETTGDSLAEAARALDAIRAFIG